MFNYSGFGSCLDNNICENGICVTLEGLSCGEIGEVCCAPGAVYRYSDTECHTGVCLDNECVEAK